MNAPEPKWTSSDVRSPRWLRNRWRTAHSAALVGHKIFVLGGLGKQDMEATENAYILDFTAKKWSMMPIPQGLDGREVFSLFAHTGTLADDTIYYVGGFIGLEGMQCSSHVFCLDLVQEDFRLVQTFGDLRGPLADHAAVYLQDRGEIVVLGGKSAASVFAEHPLFALNTETKTWRKLSWKGKTSGRRANQAVCLVGTNLFVFGGNSPNYKVLNDMFVIDFVPVVPQVTEIHLTSGPEGRFGSVLFHHKGHLFLFGGKNAFGAGIDIRLNDMFRFDLAQQSWQRCDEWTGTYCPSPRSNHKAVDLGGEVLVFGGTNVQLNNFMQITFE